MREAVVQMRGRGSRISALTLQSLWPVPERAIRAAADGVERIVVAELNPGQVVREVERTAHGVEVIGLNRIDGEMISPAEFEKAAV